MSVKKICIVSPSLKMGGIERALTVLANSFDYLGYDVVFISCIKTAHFYKLNTSISIIEPHFYRTNSITNKLIFYPRLTLFIRKAVKENNPDVVLSFGDWFNPLVLFSLWGLHYSIFISDRTSPDYKFSKFINIGKHFFYPTSRGFIAQTKRAADFKRVQFGANFKICIIPNAIREIEKYNLKREKVILYVGRFAWEKGPERLIKAFSKIENKNGWKLQMAGTGPLLESMKALAKQLNVDAEIEFLGEVKNVDFLFAKSSIYVLPSVLEGYPNSLCEAMAAGLPSICFNSFPSDEIITNGINGFIVQDGDINALSELLVKLMQDKILREKVGSEAIKVADNNSSAKIALQYIDFLFS